MPPETTKTEPGGQPDQKAESGNTSAQKLTEKAAAAAAIAVAQAEAKSVNNITLHFLLLVLFL
jgi:hypothetical protein